MSGNTTNIFVSHVHENDERVSKFKGLLERNDYPIRNGSIDSSKPNRAHDKDYIRQEILAPRIRWAGVVVVLVGPETHRSPHVNWEIEYAQQQGKRIVGVWLPGAKDSDLPKNLALYRDAMVGWNADAIIAAINGDDSSVAAGGGPSPLLSIRRIGCQG